MSRRAVPTPTILLALMVFALVAMVGAHAPRSHLSRPAARTAPVAQVAQTTATLETTILTVVDIDGNSTSSRSYTTGAVRTEIDG